MNKQVIAFLSLFSLVLVLSVYYVLVPVQAATAPVNLNYESQRAAFFTALTLQKEARQLEYINEQSLIVVNSEVSDEDKVSASTRIDAMRSVMQLEQVVYDEIRALGYPGAYVAIETGATTFVVAKDVALETTDYYDLFMLAYQFELYHPVIYDYDNLPPTFVL